MAGEETPRCYTLDPVVVTGTRIPEHLSRIGQSVAVISREEIEVLPADSVADLLETATGVDLRQRGGHGVQADVGIRGSSFEQTLVLIDGVNASDAQTGHHNLDLPVNLEEVERIEILKGPGARVYGHNAMAGVINIITRKPEENSLGGYAKYGDYDYYGVGGHGTLKAGRTANRVSVSRRYSSGHLSDEETDFDVKTLNYKGSLTTKDHEFLLGTGYTDKDFGAYRFYSDTYPDERERTETWLVHGTGHLNFSDVEVMPKVFWRSHTDDFRIRIGEDWLKNDHRTRTCGAQLGSRFPSRLGMTALGGETALEDLESSNLGDHDRHRYSLFFEHKGRKADRLFFGLGTSATYYSDWGWEHWPGGELNLEVTERLHWFASLGRSFRIPTYTELYYDTPANQGNPDLDPEKAWTYESGMRWHQKGLRVNFSLFLREEKDVIDWTRASREEPWTARNIAENETKGLEVGLTFYPEAFFVRSLVSSAGLSYTYLDADLDRENLESKYVLDHLRHQIHGSVIFNWLPGMTQTLKGRYGERMAGDSYLVADTRLAYKWNTYEVFLEVTNLFDKDYVEAGFAPMPGRWIIGGVKLEVDL
jgi:iron complex outermembrane receptor protein